MLKQTAGIHHITAIVSDAQKNIDFYAGVLGLRLVKKTVNFDDPGTYHFYFGNEGGAPGTIITFFPWPENAQQGKIGDGQVGETVYAIPPNAMAFWEQRLAHYDISFTKDTRFGETYLRFNDVHSLQLALVERAAGDLNTWVFNGVTSDVAIKGFAGATLYSGAPKATAKTLTQTLGLQQLASEGDFIRYESTANLGNTIDIKQTTVGRGIMGAGVVHHIAWRATDDNEHLAWQELVANDGYHVTPVQDRNYFNAIYFKEPGGILFEIATDTPGFAHDESFATMGESLMLPEQYEKHRQRLTEILVPITVREV